MLFHILSLWFTVELHSSVFKLRINTLAVDVKRVPCCDVEYV